MTNVAVCSYLNLAVFHIKGGNTWASGTEGLRCVHLPSPHTPSAWGHPSLPGRGRAEPPLLGNTRQESPGNTKQKSLVLGAAGPEKPPQKASPGVPAIPTIAMGLPFLVSLKLPSREPGCGRVLVLLVHAWEVGGVQGWCAAEVPTYRCMCDRLSGGRTSGGSHTWGLCLCPHSCAGSLRFHSYRLLVRPKVYTRVYKQNNKND